jgi:MoaA/NifB/PqqE/SkfB family radical SAM enzyme
MNSFSLRRTLSYMRMGVDRSYAAPVSLVLFVKGTCHAKCLHCFLPSLDEHQTARRELTPAEIEKLTHHLGPQIYSILLAGGEPFMRKDLGDILQILSTNKQLQAIKVVSNGFFTERTVATWERILAHNPHKYYGLTMSFDGLQPLHDYIRGVPHIFEKAIDTFKQLKRLGEHYPNFEVDVNVTISHFNQDYLLPLYSYLRDTLQAGNIICTVTRGVPNDTRAKDVNLEHYVNFKDMLEEDLIAGSLRGHNRFEKSDTLNAINITQRNRIAQMLENGKFISACNAGRLSAVIGSDGKVYACELLEDDLGDLRENDFDLMKLWNSPAARQLREKIYKTDCFCTYENANLLNVLFTPKYYPRILLKALSMKLTRRKARLRPVPRIEPAASETFIAPAPPAPASQANSRSLTHRILQ